MVPTANKYIADADQPETALESFTNSLDNLADTLFAQARSLNEIADRVFGPLPPSPAADGTQAKPGSLLDQVRMQLDRAGWAQRAVGEAIDRFRAL